MRRCRIVLAAGAAAAVGVAVAALVAGPAESAGAVAAVHYVALGDSYSSGVGAGDYIGSSGGCERSTKAFTALWAGAHSPASYVSVACSGATTATVAGEQLSALQPDTTLVSISIGGDDIGFSGVLKTCILHGTGSCVSAVSAAEDEARTILPSALATLFAQIRSRAPKARVVVLDYPQLYDTSVWLCLGLSPMSHRKLDEGAGVLDDVLQAATAGEGFAFGEVRAAFAGHQICDSGKWLHAVDFGDLGNSYHPTADGQQAGYLPAFTAAAAA